MSGPTAEAEAGEPAKAAEPDGARGAWRAMLPPAEASGALGAALRAAGFQLGAEAPAGAAADPGPEAAAEPTVVPAADPAADPPAGATAVVLNGAALGVAPSAADPGEADALLALLLGAQDALRRLPGGGRLINPVRGGGPAAAGALALGRALRDELGPAVAVSTVVVGSGASVEQLARLAALCAAGPGGLDEATLS